MFRFDFVRSVFAIAFVVSLRDAQKFRRLRGAYNSACRLRSDVTYSARAGVKYRREKASRIVIEFTPGECRAEWHCHCKFLRGNCRRNSPRKLSAVIGLLEILFSLSLSLAASPPPPRNHNLIPLHLDNVAISRRKSTFLYVVEMTKKMIVILMKKL